MRVALIFGWRCQWMEGNRTVCDAYVKCPTEPLTIERAVQSTRDETFLAQYRKYHIQVRQAIAERRFNRKRHLCSAEEENG